MFIKAAIIWSKYSKKINIVKYYWSLKGQFNTFYYIIYDKVTDPKLGTVQYITTFKDI